MKKYIFVIIAIVIAGGFYYFYFLQRGIVDLPTADRTKPAPNFSLQDYSGKTVGLLDFKGKPLVVNSWAVWCPFCVKELEDFVMAQKEFGDKVIIIAIDRAEPISTAKKFTDDLGVSEDLIFLLDPADSFYQSIGGFSMPETIFVNKDGDIAHHKRGPMSLEEIRERIGKIL